VASATFTLTGSTLACTFSLMAEAGIIETLSETCTRATGRDD
jgi:hypothetical protein